MEPAIAQFLEVLEIQRKSSPHTLRAYGIDLHEWSGAMAEMGFKTLAQVDRGLLRLGVPKAARRYFTLHATLDVKHSEAWNREVLRPLAEEPRAARAMAEGALMRLGAGARCFARYRSELQPDGLAAATAPAVGSGVTAQASAMRA